MSMGSTLLGYFKRLPGMILSALGDLAPAVERGVKPSRGFWTA